MPRSRTAGAAPLVPTGLVRQLGLLLGELGLSEIEVSVGDLRVRVQRHLATAAAVAPASAASVVTGPPAPLTAAPAPPPALSVVEAPMVGTFYRAASPTAAPYVQVGDVVKEGQTLAIIEAMKLMNEIEATVGGRIVEILAENGQGVEFGQPIVVIDPAG